MGVRYPSGGMGGRTVIRLIDAGPATGCRPGMPLPWTRFCLCPAGDRSARRKECGRATPNSPSAALIPDSNPRPQFRRGKKNDNEIQATRNCRRTRPGAPLHGCIRCQDAGIRVEARPGAADDAVGGGRVAGSRAAGVSAATDGSQGVEVAQRYLAVCVRRR